MAEKSFYSRQDSGFGSGAPTPVTPSQQDLHLPQPLPPIAERMSEVIRGETSRRSRSSIDNGHQRHLGVSNLDQQRSNQRPRPTSLSPNPFAHAHESHTTPVSPSFSLIRHINNEDYLNAPPEIQNGIKKRADKIVSDLVPEAMLPPPPPCAGNGEVIIGRTSDVTPHCEALPRQEICYELDRAYLQPGEDGYYHEHRDYYKSELLGTGGFGKVYVCCDNTKLTMFAMKCNTKSNPDINEAKRLTTMLDECHVMNSIGSHDNITRFMGALIDDFGSDCGKIGRMMLEMAPNGDLSQLLVDQETGESGLPLDQSLYYLQQILYAVHYLHSRNTLHLDLKSQNVLVFNDGRTVKLSDFGTAVKIDGFQTVKAFTPNFSAPEVVRSNNCPTFSADIWSVMCVLVEMLTGKLPWCYQYDMQHHQVIMMVGNYCDNQFPLLVPADDLQLDEDIVELMKCVLQHNASERPTALDLLRHSVIKDAYEYEKYFDTESECLPPSDETTPPVGRDMNHFPDTSHKMSSTTDLLPSAHKVRQSLDSGTGSSIPDRSSTGSNSVMTGTPDSTDDLLRGKISPSGHILRHKSVPSTLPSYTTWHSITANELASRYKELSIPSPTVYRNSAPSRLSYLEEPRTFEGEEVESDGLTYGKGHLKRTTSAQYVLNGPETDTTHWENFPLLTQSSRQLEGTVSVGTQTTSSPTIESRPNLNCPTHQRR